MPASSHTRDDFQLEMDAASLSLSPTTTTVHYNYGTGSLAVGSALLSGLDHVSISRRLENARATIPHRNDSTDKGLDDMYSDLFEMAFRRSMYPRRFTDQAQDLLVTQVRWHNHKHTICLFRNLSRWPKHDIIKSMERWPTDCSNFILEQLPAHIGNIPIIPKTEFQISAEVYILNHGNAGVTTRKLRKKEKWDPGDEKLREKPHWVSLARSLTSFETGQWKPAVCKLFDEGESVVLTITLNGMTSSCQTVNVRSLSQTNIRPADNSLFSRQGCLGIYPNSDDEDEFDPIYLHFADTNTRQTWIDLLRIYAKPESYGHNLFPESGGLYRMWRQIDVSIIQGRNLSAQAPFPSDPAHSPPPPPSGNTELSCDIYINDILCGRTIAKKGDDGPLGNPEWHQSFAFPNFGPLDTLDVLVWQGKKQFTLRSRTKSISGGQYGSVHPSARKLNALVLGALSVPLAGLKRGEICESWFPVLYTPASGGIPVQKGEIKVKIRIEEEIVLPSSSKAYSDLIATLDLHNIVYWLKILDKKLQLRTTSLTLLAIARNKLLDQLLEAAKEEVANSPISQSNTMFRGNTTFNKTVEEYMMIVGRQFMRLSIGPVLVRIYSEQVAIEVNPSRQPKSSAKEIGRNGLKLLIHWCREVWSSIYATREECPNEIRQLLEYIRKLVNQHYRINELSGLDPRRNLPLQSVSSFCFLRFFTPAILNPHRFGLCSSPATPTVQRSLTLIAKVIQSLANMHQNSTEDYMRGVEEFFQETLSSMTDYLVVVSTPMPGAMNNVQDEIGEVLQSRTATLPILHQDSVPHLAPNVDIPQTLALITSAVIRSSRGTYDAICDSADNDADCSAVQDLCERCFDVEEEALRCVGDLAVRQGFIEDFSLAADPERT